jgi:hypothetical protein
MAKERLRPSPAEMAIRGRIGAFSLHARQDARVTTEPARRAFMDRFAREVDPDGVLPPDERERRAQAAKRRYFTALALRSSRRRARARKPGADDTSRSQVDATNGNRHEKTAESSSAVGGR